MCRHEGACCTAGWTIPVERPIYDKLRLYFGPDPALFDADGSRADTPTAVLGRRASGECIFFDADRGRLCAIHRDLGAEHLPTACRQFPRVVLHDGRGTLISLSHFCPTAAELLATNGAIDHCGSPLEIIAAPTTLTLAGTAEGLDARDALPPLLRPGMLTDLDAYDRWERRAIRVLSDEGIDAARVIERIAEATRRIQDWRPGGTPLAAVVEHEFDVAPAAEANEDPDADDARVSAAIASVPAGLPCPPRFDGVRREWREAIPWWPQMDRIVRRYLATRLFGNWIAYHGLGLHGIVEYLRVCLSVLEMETVRYRSAHARTALTVTSPWPIVKEGIRNADLLLVHLSDPTDLSRRLS
jgi:Fe-S-cluster containining protein